MKFRLLKADEIDCRVSTCSEKGVSLLLYKDARVDMNILDETVGPMNWQRSHTRDNSNCVVSIWDSEKNQWVGKEDTGTESFTEKEKGLASDSFKRACFNWGIGRELYTAPFIWIKAANVNLFDKRDGKKSTYDKFAVQDIGYDSESKINALTIKNAQTGRVVFDMKAKVEPEKVKTIGVDKVAVIVTLLGETGTNVDEFLNYFKVTDVSQMNEMQFKKAVALLEKKKEV